MADQPLRVQHATVPYGTIQIDGYMAESGWLGMSLTQLGLLAEITEDAQHSATRLTEKLRSKESKSLYPQGFSCHRGIVTNDRNRRVALIEVDLVGAVLAVCGTFASRRLLANGFSLSVRQCLCDTFQIKFEAEERQQWLTLRQQSKLLYKELADEIQVYATLPERTQPVWIYYANAYDAINLNLFGKKAKQIRQELGIGDDALNRDHFGPNSLRWIATVQEVSAKHMQADRTLKPTVAVQRTVQANCVTVMDFRH